VHGFVGYFGFPVFKGLGLPDPHARGWPCKAVSRLVGRSVGRSVEITGQPTISDEARSN
jgi:hypothetical protein